MKTNLFLSLVVLGGCLLAGCAVTHKRGSDAQVTVDYYLENRGALPNELAKMVVLDRVKEADVTIQWSVNDQGDTQDVSILNDTLRNEKVNTLLIEHLKAMKFPKAPRFTTTTVEYTYKFQQHQPPPTKKR